MKGKIILIEGVDCSGKETQSKLIVKRLNEKGIKCEYFSFPNYDSPTGKIIGGPFLGKEYISKSYFEEGSINVDPKVSSLYYAADRLYNINLINNLIDNGITVILDRYIYSNMAFQGSKITEEKQRKEMYKWIENLEFDFLNLPAPDMTFFLHLPSEISIELLNKRGEKADGNESDSSYLNKSEQSYLELCDIYNFIKIECFKNGELRKIEEINDELLDNIERGLKIEKSNVHRKS